MWGSARQNVRRPLRNGQTVKAILVNELDATGLYDEVYASASLTHVPRHEACGVIKKI